MSSLHTVNNGYSSPFNELSPLYGIDFNSFSPNSIYQDGEGPADALPDNNDIEYEGQCIGHTTTSYNPDEPPPLEACSYDRLEYAEQPLQAASYNELYFEKSPPPIAHPVVTTPPQVFLIRREQVSPPSQEHPPLKDITPPQYCEDDAIRQHYWQALKWFNETITRFLPSEVPQESEALNEYTAPKADIKEEKILRAQFIFTNYYETLLEMMLYKNGSLVTRLALKSIEQKTLPIVQAPPPQNYTRFFQKFLRVTADIREKMKEKLESSEYGAKHKLSSGNGKYKRTQSISYRCSRTTQKLFDLAVQQCLKKNLKLQKLLGEQPFPFKKSNQYRYIPYKPKADTIPTRCHIQALNSLEVSFSGLFDDKILVPVPADKNDPSLSKKRGQSQNTAR